MHLLVCPKKHIKNFKFLKKEDLPMLRELAAEANSLGEKYSQGSKFRVGFHKPPFYSIKHLHLHVCVEPITGCFNNYLKYGWNMKGVDSVIEHLSKL